MTSPLETALSDLETLAAKKKVPTRHDARPILLGLGRWLAEHPGEAPDGTAGRLRKLPPGVFDAWTAAVRDEIAMSATEFVCSVDPKYLGHPQYDWGYTLEARDLLEDRLGAARHLGIVLDEKILSDIRRADRLLAERRRSKPPNS